MQIENDLNKLDMAGTETTETVFTDIMIENQRRAEKQCDSKEWTREGERTGNSAEYNKRKLRR